MSKVAVKPLFTLLGGALAGSVLRAHAATGDMSFRLQALAAGYAIAARNAPAATPSDNDGFDDDEIPA